MSKISDLIGNSQSSTMHASADKNDFQCTVSSPVIGKDTAIKIPAQIIDPGQVTTVKVPINDSLDEIMRNVDHPSHYQTKSGIEAIDVIEAFELGFNLGNVVKYILRCGKKDSDVQELQKAKWYLEREISNRQGLCQ